MSAAVAFVAALIVVDVPLPAPLGWLAWPGGPASARTLLQVVAGSVITVTGLTFSVTVVALQLASQQFSPRLLRDFTRDRVIKGVLAILVSVFVFAITVLREAAPRDPLPHLALLAVSVLGVVALAAVLGFITHLAKVLRVDTMMRAVHEETNNVIAAFYPPHGRMQPYATDERQFDRGSGVPLFARTSGFVRRIRVPRLVYTAKGRDVVILVEVRPGDHVVRDTPIATVCDHGDQRPSAKVREEIEGVVNTALVVSYERTAEQDAAFGFRQLTDIAVKAISPGINDPVTADHAIGHMSDLLVKLARQRLGPTLHQDAGGVGRVVIPGRDLRYYLDLACGPIRRYGRREPTVLISLLRLLRDLAAVTHDDEQRQVVTRQTDLILAELPGAFGEHDAAAVRDMADRVRRALRGETRSAYWDRSGETRSI